MSVAQLEGDAVLSYPVDDDMPSGQAFIETIDTIFVEFRRALELMVINTSCDCNACANIGGLDLKFFVHHGSFVEQPVFDHRQLLGSDVNLIHRFLKNSVTEATGVSAYLMITENARQSLGIASGPGGVEASHGGGSRLRQSPGLGARHASADTRRAGMPRVRSIPQ